jgi:abortive infection bacteriophage resistance protein
MANFAKPALTADAHLALLKSRNLLIEEKDEVKIKSYLRKIGYYRLSGYFGTLQSEKDRFKDGTTFWNIINLYKFDHELRLLTLDALYFIEVELRARITDIYSISYDCFWYLDKENFIADTQTIEVSDTSIDENNKIIEGFKQIEIPIYNVLLNEILKSIENLEQTDYMKYFRMSYSPDSSVPSWMVFENLSFGKLSKIYALLKKTAI